MSIERQGIVNDRREDLVAYLLGELPEEEQLAIEHDYFTNDDTYADLLAVEDELAYEYAENRLSPVRRRNFEATIGATERGRRNVELARALLSALRASQGSTAGVRSPYWVASIAAALVVGVLAGWLTLRQEIVQLREIAAAKSAPALAPVEASFLLTPGLSRSEAGPPRLELRPEADILNLELLAPPGAAAGDYVIEIRANDSVVLSQSTRFTGRTFTARASAKLFIPGAYEASVRRLNAGEQSPDLATYTFRLTRP